MNKYLYIIAGFLLGIGVTVSANNITSGAIPYGNGGADWVLLTTNGGGVMSWDYDTKLPIMVSTTSLNMTGSGTVTSVATNNGLTGGTITTTGTIGLASIAANSVLGTIGSSGIPMAVATSSLFQTASASLSGLLSSTDWTTFNGKQATIAATYPIILTGATLSFPATSTLYSNLSAGGMYINALGQMASAATTTYSTGLTYANGAVTCDVATGSVPGCLSAANWTTFNAKESALTFNYPLTRSVNAISMAASSTLYANLSSVTLAVSTNGTIYGAATTTATSPITYANGSFSCATCAVFRWEWTNVASGFGTTTAIMGIGTTTPVANFQATTATANATTSVSFGKKGQNKGTCLTMYNVSGTPAYVYVVGTTLTVTATKLAGCQD